MTLPRALSWLAILAICTGGAAWAQAPNGTKPRHETRGGAQYREPRRLPPTRPQDQVRPTTLPTTGPAGSAAMDEAEQASQPDRRFSLRGLPLVELEIVGEGQPWGLIVLELNEGRATTTVRNFLRYVDEGFYNGTIFHRVLSDFIIQGGGYVSPTERKTEGLYSPIRNETMNGLKNVRGALAMARKQRDPHSATAQFFIDLADNETLDYSDKNPYGYCVFGKVVDGMDVVERLAHVRTHVSAAAQARFARFKAEDLPVEQAEMSEPDSPPMIKSARRLSRTEYEARAGHQPQDTEPAAATPVEGNAPPEAAPGVPPTPPQPEPQPESSPAEEPPTGGP